MRDYLLDIVQHTIDLGVIDLVKITGDDKDTQIAGVGSDQSVVIDARFHNPIPDFIGVFGMPNLAKLKTILNLEEYREGATLTMTRNSTNELDGIEFKNKTGDFRNNYRFMTANIVTKKMPTPKFKGVNWHVEFQPTAAAIQRLKWQMSANSEEPNFSVKIVSGDLKFSFGDHSTHAGEFVFHPGVSGALKRVWSWPAGQVSSILSLSGDKTFRISDDGAAMITVDSGLAVYNYILPAQSK